MQFHFSIFIKNNKTNNNKVQSTPVISKPDITKYPLIARCDISSRVLNALFSPAYNECAVISKEYTGPLDFEETGVDCIIIIIIINY